MVLLSLLILASPPPNWQVLPAPEGHTVNRIAWSPDGQSLAVCGSEAVSLVAPPVQQIRIADHPCSDILFDGTTVVYASRHDETTTGVWQTTQTTPKRLIKTPIRALARRGTAIWMGGKELLVWANGRVIQRAPFKGIRRLIETPGGMLVVTHDAVLRVDDQLAVQQRFTPQPKPSPNGIYDATALPDGRVAAVDNRGSLWVWSADGTLAGHAYAIGSANSIIWTGQALVIGDIWVDPQTVRLVARAFRQPRHEGPLALSPDRKRIAVPLHRGVLLRSAMEPAEQPRGMPSGAHGMVVTPSGVWVGDRDGRLIEFDRSGRVKSVHPLSKDGLRDLVGDPEKTLYAATEWGDIIAWRKTGPYVRWDTRSGERLALTQDGKTLYVGGQRTADRLDTTTGKRTSMQPLPEDGYPTFLPTLTPTDEVIWFRRDRPGTWHRADGTTQPIMQAASGQFDVRGRLWTTGYKTAAIHTWPKRAVVHRIEDLRETRFVPLPGGGMAASGWSGAVTVFDAQGKTKWSVHAPWHVGGIAKLGNRLLTSGPDLTISAWTMGGKRSDWAPPGRGQSVSGLAFSSDSRFLAVGADSTGVRVWDLKTHRMVRDLATEPGDVHVHQHGADWFIRQNTTVHRWPVAGGPGTSIKMPERWGSVRDSPHTQAPFILQDGEKKTWIIDLHTGKKAWGFKMPEGVRTTALAPDGQSVAVLVPGEQMELQIHRRNGRASKGIRGPYHQIYWQGDTLWVSGEERTWVWRGTALKVQPHRPAFVSGMAYGGGVVALSDGKVVQLRSKGRLVRTVPVERHGEAFLRLSPDGTVLAIGGNFTGGVVLWSVQTGTPIARYEAFADGLWQSTDAAGKVLGGKTIREQK